MLKLLRLQLNINYCLMFTSCEKLRLYYILPNLFIFEFQLLTVVVQAIIRRQSRGLLSWNSGQIQNRFSLSPLVAMVKGCMVMNWTCVLGIDSWSLIVLVYMAMYSTSFAWMWNSLHHGIYVLLRGIRWFSVTNGCFLHSNFMLVFVVETKRKITELRMSNGRVGHGIRVQNGGSHATIKLMIASKAM